MKLEVGQFVRTKDGIIDKVTIDYNGHCASPNCECKHISCAKNYYDEDTVTKASYNIIDILEIGDYVNGNEIYKISWDSLGLILETTDFFKLREKDIKSVITHEQMEQMAYKVVE